MLPFAAVDNVYRTSRLFTYDLATNQLKERLNGQSGDPWLSFYDNQLIFFNRQETIFNMLSFHRVSGKFENLRQIPCDTGDPHGLVEVAEQKMAIACWVRGVAFIRQFGEDSVADLLLNHSERPFRPRDMWLGKFDGQDALFLIHQGVDNLWNGNSTQKIYVYLVSKIKELQGKAKSLDPIASFPLRSTNASLLRHSSQKLIVGLCYPGSMNCTSAVEILNPSSNQLELLADLTPLPYSSNGSLASGPNDSSFFANVVEHKSATKQLVLISFAQGQVTVNELYRYDVNGSGSYLLAFVERHQLLMVGDRTPSGGELLLFKPGESIPSTKVALPLIPYAAPAF